MKNLFKPSSPGFAHLPIIITLVLVLGVVGYLMMRGSAPEVNNQNNTNQDIEAPEGWQTYTNTEFGFEIDYPEDRTAWKDTQGTDYGVDAQLIPASSIDRFVAIAETEAHLFCCEALTFSVEIQDQLIDDLETWVNTTYLTSENSHAVLSKGYEQFADIRAYRVHSSTGLDSPKNIIALNNSGYTYLIKYDNVAYFEPIISSFRFIN